jgi:putative transposase
MLARMSEIAGQYTRACGGRDGHKMSFGRAYRLRSAAKLQVPRKYPRKRIASGRPRVQTPSRS